MAKNAKKNILKFWGIHFVPQELAASPAPHRKAVFPLKSAKSASPSKTSGVSSHITASQKPSAPKFSGKNLSVKQKQKLLDELRVKIERSKHCGLEKTCTNLVFGEGNPDADIVFVGEAPGFEEDKTGKPFVGRAGQLLTDIITKGMNIPREKVYICNVLKCRPPQNRTPIPDEIHLCTPWLVEQLQIIYPKVIIALGASAVRGLLPDIKDGITKIRGQFYEYHLDGPGTDTGDIVQLMPTFHPAYLLRNPPAKKYVWDDIQKVMAYVGLPIPTKKTSGKS